MRSRYSRSVIGRYPTPVQFLPGLSTSRTELWVKRDDLTSDIYGGNKVRKLEHILESARARGARRIVTFGTAGSHQALATTVHGRRAGFEVAAILTPQPRTDYAVGNLRAGLALGLQAMAAPSFAAVPLVLARVVRRGDFIVEPGGSSVTGTLGYVDAAFELDEQVRSGALPCPDAIVVPLGSGGTASGLVAGVVALGLATKVIGVRIVGPALMGKGRVLWLALRAARRRGLTIELAALTRTLEVERGYLGRGYGYATHEGDRAAETAAREGLVLDATYTAKTLAAAIALVEEARFRRILYWHTLSSAPLAQALESAPELPPELQRLFTSR
jgi:1-aminocyclopropane-1-carboxylate deaminase/D-cysteine desulfhydrase-like pyridoxal-dependent ACC family enzyme